MKPEFCSFLKRQHRIDLGVPFEFRDIGMTEHVLLTEELMKRIFFSVGEPSGDLHGGNLIRQLKSYDEPIECVGYGGPKMVAQGLDQHYDLTRHAVMMLFTIIKKLRFFFSLVDQAEEYFTQNKVDAVVLIDYPGFNWHIAKRAKKHGIPVFYYGVPQIWAWAPWRIKKVRRTVDHVLCKLPFEKEWFEKRGCKATYVGHPFFDQLVNQEYDSSFMKAFRPEQSEEHRELAPLTDLSSRLPVKDIRETNEKNRIQLRLQSSKSAEGSPSPVLLLLPGSRDREVKANLPEMIRAAERCQRRVPNLRVAIGNFKQEHCSAAKEMLSESKLNAELYVERTPELMKSADVCIACSGSVSLELMYHRLPTIIVYKIGRLAKVLEGVLIRARFITLVNLLKAPKITRDGMRTYDPDAIGAETVPMPEYLSTRDKSVPIAERAVRWLTDPDARREAVASLDEMATEFGKPGASCRAADYIASRIGVSKRQKRVA